MSAQGIVLDASMVGLAVTMVSGLVIASWAIMRAIHQEGRDVRADLGAKIDKNEIKADERHTNHEKRLDILNDRVTGHDGEIHEIRKLCACRHGLEDPTPPKGEPT